VEEGSDLPPKPQQNDPTPPTCCSMTDAPPPHASSTCQCPGAVTPARSHQAVLEAVQPAVQAVQLALQQYNNLGSSTRAVPVSLEVMCQLQWRWMIPSNNHSKQG
jgi:hypothetical protein